MGKNLYEIAQELKNSTNKQLELFELETINQINKLF